MVFGNNTETTFGYNINNHHLTTHTLKDGTASANQLLDKSFVYSDAGNITSILNNAVGVNYGYSVFGGQYQNNYTYDLMNRLSTVSGTLQGADGNLDQTTLSMSYDLVGSITNKNQLHQRNGMDVGNTYNYNYLKNNTAQPHTITEIQDPNINIQMNYDANGNMTREEGIAPGGSPAQSYLNMFLWDENNRLIAENNAGGFHHFLYDSDGTRYLKGSIWTGTAGVNGQNIGQTFMQGDYTVYVSPYVVVNLSQTKDPVYSKHYYQGQERIASRVGSWPTNLSNPNSGESVQAHPMWGPIESGTSSWDVDRGFLEPEPQHPFEPELIFEDANGCMDFYQNDPLEAERCVCENYPDQAGGLGIDCETDALYYYHSDYLGNVEYITDKNGRAYQYFWYSAWGEVLKEDHAHTGNFDNPYRFNGKEVDPETGLHYYGARYYDSRKSVWLGVDPIPKSHENPFSSMGNNPIILIDTDGRDTTFADETARKNFKQTLFIVKSKVDKFQKRVDENNNLKNKKGIMAALKRLVRNEKMDKSRLNRWKKLEFDFDKITSKETPCVEYSTDESLLNSNENGTTTPSLYIKGASRVVFRKGNLAAIVHENRHVVQIFNGETGFEHNTDYGDEIEAYEYQMIFNYESVQDLIDASAASKFGQNWREGPNYNYGLEDFVRDHY